MKCHILCVSFLILIWLIMWLYRFSQPVIKGSHQRASSSCSLRQHRASAVTVRQRAAMRQSEFTRSQHPGGVYHVRDARTGAAVSILIVWRNHGHGMLCIVCVSVDCLYSRFFFHFPSLVLCMLFFSFLCVLFLLLMCSLSDWWLIFKGPSLWFSWVIYF